MGDVRADPEFTVLSKVPITAERFRELLDSRINIPKSALKKGSTHRALKKAVNSLVCLTYAFHDPSYHQGNRAVITLEVQKLEVRRLIAIALYGGTPTIVSLALACIHFVFPDLDHESGMPADVDIVQRVFECMSSPHLEILEAAASAAAHLVLGADGESEEVTARKDEIRKRLARMGAIEALIKLLKSKRKDQDSSAMESAYALSGFLAGRTGLDDVADVEKLALDPGLIPGLLELSRSPHCDGEVQKMALQCMAAIATISPATALALKKAGAEGVAQRALDTGMAYEPLHRPRTLQNATKLLQNIQRQLLLVESEDASEEEVVDDYAASMSEEDAAAASQGLMELFTHLLDSGPDSVRLLGEIATAAFGAPGPCRRTKKEVMTLLRGVKRTELQRLVWSPAFAGLLMRASPEEKEKLAYGGTLKAIAKMLHNKDPKKYSLTMRAASLFSNAPRLVPLFWKLGIFKEAMDAIVAIDPDAIVSDDDTCLPSACTKIIANHLVSQAQAARVPRNYPNPSVPVEFKSDDRPDAVNVKALKALKKGGVFPRIALLFAKYAELKPALHAEAVTATDHSLRLFMNACLIDDEIEGILGQLQGLAPPLAYWLKNPAAGFALRAAELTYKLIPFDPFWRGLAAESGLLRLLCKQSKHNISVGTNAPLTGCYSELCLARYIRRRTVIHDENLRIQAVDALCSGLKSQWRRVHMVITETAVAMQRNGLLKKEEIDTLWWPQIVSLIKPDTISDEQAYPAVFLVSCLQTFDAKFGFSNLPGFHLPTPADKVATAHVLIRLGLLDAMAKHLEKGTPSVVDNMLVTSTALAHLCDFDEALLQALMQHPTLMLQLKLYALGRHKASANFPMGTTLGRVSIRHILNAYMAAGLFTPEAFREREEWFYEMSEVAAFDTKLLKAGAGGMGRGKAESPVAGLAATVGASVLGGRKGDGERREEGPTVAQKCAACGKGGEVKRCSRCQDVAYCSQTCQRKGWPEHKRKCKAS